MRGGINNKIIWIASISLALNAFIGAFYFISHADQLNQYAKGFFRDDRREGHAEHE